MEKNSVNNDRWGLGVIEGHGGVICVNAMWQTSAVKEGPPARNRTAWGKNSLVQVLVDRTLARVSLKETSPQPKRDPRFLALGTREDFTPEEQAVLLQVNKRVGELWPNALLARTALIYMKRLVFARSSEEVMGLAGLDVCQKYGVAGHCLKLLNAINLDTVIRHPCSQRMLQQRAIVAFGVLLAGSALALDYDADRALRGLIRGKVGADGMGGIKEQIMAWHALSV